ncbi:MAG: c-type cytochrome [Ginsengibacter sp.]
MKKVIVISILIVSILLITAISFVFIRSNVIINKKYNVALIDVAVPHDSVSIAAGKKIASTRGCFGCHNKSLSGEFYPYWETGMVAATISRKIPQYSDKELFRLFKHGIKKDGTGLWSMPAGMFVNLSKKDIFQLIAFLRTVPAVEKKLPQNAFSFKGRMKIVSGEIISEVSMARQSVKKFNYPEKPTIVQQGNYLVLTTCTECHGYDLKGAYGSPPLIIAKAYKEGEFVKFLHTGKALGGRELQMMSETCRTRFIHYSEEEIKSIHAFLMQLEK